MSVVSIRSALETALAAISPPIATAWENDAFTPPDLETPYQAAFLMLAQPDNTEIGPQHVQRGIFQVSLFYPLAAGTAAVNARAEMVRAAFRRGLSLTSGGIIVTVEKTAEIGPGAIADDRFVLPVRVRFYAPVPN